jgi:hypothetical protein
MGEIHRAGDETGPVGGGMQGHRSIHHRRRRHADLGPEHHLGEPSPLAGLGHDAVGVVDMEYATSRDPVLREQIILAYLGLADRLADRYRHSRGSTPEDLIQPPGPG